MILTGLLIGSLAESSLTYGTFDINSTSNGRLYLSTAYNDNPSSFPVTSPLNVVRRLVSSNSVLSYNDDRFSQSGLSVSQIVGSLKLLSNRQDIITLTSAVPFGGKYVKSYYIWNRDSLFYDQYVSCVSSYFLAREMGELSDVISFTGLSDVFVDACVGYLFQKGDLKIVTDKPVIFKWAHDIEFSEGVETVHLEID